MRREQTGILLAIAIAPYYLNGLYNPVLASTPKAFWLVELLTWVAMPLAVWFYGRGRCFSNVDLGFHTRLRGRRAPSLLVLVIAVVALLLACVDEQFWEWATRVFPRGQSDDGFDYRQMLPAAGPETGWLRLAVVVFFSASAGLVEEFLYRGVFRCLFGKRWFQTALYVTVSSVVFAGAHWEFGPPVVAFAFLYGVSFALLYVATGNLWPNVVGHALVDLLVFSS